MRYTNSGLLPWRSTTSDRYREFLHQGTNMNEIDKNVKTHDKRFLDELFELIRIPSVSSLPEHKPDMYRAAEKWKEILLAAGAGTFRRQRR